MNVFFTSPQFHRFQELRTCEFYLILSSSSFKPLDYTALFLVSTLSCICHASLLLCFHHNTEKCEQKIYTYIVNLGFEPVTGQLTRLVRLRLCSMWTEKYRKYPSSRNQTVNRPTEGKPISLSREV